jgi:chorismate-pyruvate lyase
MRTYNLTNQIMSTQSIHLVILTTVALGVILFAPHIEARAFTASALLITLAIFIKNN